MKNSAQNLLLLITILFAGVMIGLLIGRASNTASVQLSAYTRTSCESTEDDQSSNSDTHGKININIATAKELAMLPGIGETYAQRIVDYRTQNGLFASIYELENVDGIGAKRIQAISEYITVGG